MSGYEGVMRCYVCTYEPKRNLRSQSKNLLVKSRVNTKMFWTIGLFRT